MRSFNDKQIYGSLAGTSLLCCSSFSAILEPIGSCKIPQLDFRGHFSVERETARNGRQSRERRKGREERNMKIKTENEKNFKMPTTKLLKSEIVKHGVRFRSAI